MIHKSNENYNMNKVNYKNTKLKKVMNFIGNGNRDQMTSCEYKFLATLIFNLSPCKVLVFGLGRDSKFWIKSNQNGKTVFIENSVQWENIARKELINEQNLSNFEIIHYDYDTQVINGIEFTSRIPPSKTSSPNTGHVIKNYFKQRKWKNLHDDLFMKNLSKSVLNENWDVIIVDAPVGKREGRMKSIYTASYLSHYTRKNTHLFVHDINRNIEHIYTKHLFHQNDYITRLYKLGYWIISGNNNKKFSEKLKMNCPSQ